MVWNFIHMYRFSYLFHIKLIFVIWVRGQNKNKNFDLFHQSKWVSKPVNPKGNQPWMFIGKTDAEAEVPILWAPDAKNWLLRKDPDASKVMLKILRARLQQYVNRELPDVQAGFRKGRGTRDQIANICWIIEKVREFQKKHLLLLYWLCQSLWLWGSQ